MLKRKIVTILCRKKNGRQFSVLCAINPNRPRAPVTKRTSLVLTRLFTPTSRPRVRQPVPPSTATSTEASASQEFLDSQQYATNSILRYEKIFGKHFVSTGGATTTSELVAKLNLEPNQRVLDVGCGIGGSAFYMAKQFQANVLGIDLSTNMISIAQNSSVDEKKTFEGGAVEFLVANALEIELEANSFDVVYSRDAILHILEKTLLFERFFDWLKPGGKLLITDYAQGQPPYSEEFQEYAAQRGYHLTTVGEYGELLANVGFRKVFAEDRTKQFVDVLGNELEKFTAPDVKEDFLISFSQEDYDNIVDGWLQKQVRCAEGDQVWGAYFAVKPDVDGLPRLTGTYY